MPVLRGTIDQRLVNVRTLSDDVRRNSTCAWTRKPRSISPEFSMRATMFETASFLRQVRPAWLALAGILLSTFPAARLEAPYRMRATATSTTEPPSTPPDRREPESKLWWNDGSWWGSLWDRNANRYSIHRFEPGTQSGQYRNRDRSTVQHNSDALWTASSLHRLPRVREQLRLDVLRQRGASLSLSATTRARGPTALIRAFRST